MLTKAEAQVIKHEMDNVDRLLKEWEQEEVEKDRKLSAHEELVSVDPYQLVGLTIGLFILAFILMNR